MVPYYLGLPGFADQGSPRSGEQFSTWSQDMRMRMRRTGPEPADASLQAPTRGQYMLLILYMYPGHV